jgi:hypothetical protein
MRLITGFVGAAALVVLLTPAAQASQWNNLVYLTFSGPVQVPGATLPAGTYAFKTADQWGDPHVIEILSKDMRTIYATEITMPAERYNAPSGKPVVVLAETPAGTPPAIEAWYLPGQLVGNEFVYEGRQAHEVAVAKLHSETVRAAKG